MTTVSIITLYAYLQIKDSVQWIPGHFCGMAMRSIDGRGNSPVLQIPCQFVKNHFFVEANTNFNLLNMAIAVGMDEINPNGSKMPHKHEYAYSHFAPCNLERNTG